MPTIVKYYCDGACHPNPGKGGYAWIKVVDGLIEESGGDCEKHTTNQRMELMAMLACCKNAAQHKYLSAFSDYIIEIYTDSAYLYRCNKEKWYDRWRENGWMTSSKTPVVNQDLWEALIPYFEKFNLKIIKVKGHSGNKYNEIVDELAVSYRMG